MWKFIQVAIPLFSVMVAGKMFAQGSDSLVTLNITQAREKLVQENLMLLAQEFDISNAEASVIQAKLWNNLTFIWNADMYSVELNEYFDYRNQRLVQVEMMVPAISKRLKGVKLAEIGVEKAKLEFEVLIQELMLDMETTFHNLHCTRQNEVLLTQMEKIFENVILASEKQLEVGAISGSEFTRLKSELLSLKSQLSANQILKYELEYKLKVLLNVPVDATLEVDDPFAKPDTLFTYDQMINMAAQNRPDYLLSEVEIAYNQQNLKYQRVSAFGDTKIGYQPHDKGSNYVRPYSGVVIELPLPVFNRNQGNIAAAKNDIEKSKVLMVLKENEMQSDIMSAYMELKSLEELNAGYDTAYLESLEVLQSGASENFTNRSITILEYLDFQRIYLQTLLDYNTVQCDYRNALAGVNFLVGKTVY